MTDGPVIIASDALFRLVRMVEGDRVTYVMEVPDGCDALGVERWREFKLDNKHLRALRDFIIRGSLRDTTHEPQ